MALKFFLISHRNKFKNLNFVLSKKLRFVRCFEHLVEHSNIAVRLVHDEELAIAQLQGGSDEGGKQVMEIFWQPHFYLSAIEIAAFEVVERKVAVSFGRAADFVASDKFVEGLEVELVELEQLAEDDSIAVAVVEEFDIVVERMAEFSDSMQSHHQFVESTGRDSSHIVRLMDCRRVEFDKLD
jgi:hypothetical protein